MKSVVFSFIFVAAIFGIMTPVEGAYIFKNGKFYDAKDVATKSVHEHYSAGLAHFEKKKYKAALDEFRMIVYSFPKSPFAQDSLYYLGVCYYSIRDYDLANNYFTDYLKEHGNPKFFEETVRFKLAIADKFRNGAKRHLMGLEKMPKWASGKKTALALYDEVVAALPSSELAAQALVSKGEFLRDLKEYRDSVESYQMLIQRFPKHQFAPEGYLSIAETYYLQCQAEMRNPDLISLASINLRRFKQDFPGEERLVKAELYLLKIKEVYVQGLYDTGLFYERIKKPQASVLYYHNAISNFPETSIAGNCRDRMDGLKEHADKLEIGQDKRQLIAEDKHQLTGDVL